MSARYYEAVGRRKTSTARVRLYPGTGTIMVNERQMAEYFPRETDVLAITRPAPDDGNADSYNISIHVGGRRAHGPGRCGRAWASPARCALPTRTCGRA
jgi:small subunit ribosomal protein S9